MKNTVVCLVILLCCLIAGSLQAQESWKNYTKDDGLPNNEIRAIAEDGNGVMWFCIEEGGVVKNIDGQWTVYDKSDGLFGNIVRAIAIDKSSLIWCGGINGISSFNGADWTTYQDCNGLNKCHVTSIVVDNDNTKWFGTYGHGVYSYDGQKWLHYSKQSGLLDDIVLSLECDDSGRIWMGTYKGVSVFDGTIWREFTEVQDGLNCNTVFSITEAPDGSMWFGTHMGVCRYDGGNEWTTFTAVSKYDILHNRDVYSIDFDNNGNMWLGTSTGIWSYSNNSWDNYTHVNSQIPYTSYFFAVKTASNGKNWIGHNKGLLMNSFENPKKLGKATVPLSMAIKGNYPNPFNPSTTIDFTLTESGFVTLAVYNISGQKVRTLLSSEYPAGNHTIVWDGKNESGLSLATGVYFLRLQMGKQNLTHRIMLMK